MAKKTRYVNEGNSYCRNWALELYTEWDNFDDVIKFIESHYSNYAYIYHDKDIWTEEDYLEKQEYCNSNNIKVGDLKKLHCHVAVQFNNPRYRQTIANELNIDVRWVRKSTKFKKFLKYLVHHDEIDKYHYSVIDVKGTLAYKVALLCSQDIDIETKSSELLDLIMSRNTWTLYAFTREVNKRGLYSVFRQGYSLYKDLIQDHNMGVF